jgi:TolB protein
MVVYTAERDSGRSDLFVADLATGLARRLTYSGDPDGPPQWTEHGTRIAYHVMHGDTLELRTVRPDGGGMRRSFTRVAKSAAVSNDGRRVAYTVGSWTSSRIWVADADGSRSRAVSDSLGAYYNLAWSPDDRRLAVTHRDTSGVFHILLVNPDSAARPRELVHLPDSEGHPQWPAWSPDGKRLAFQSGRYVRGEPEKSDASVYVLDVASGAIRKLRTHPRPLLDETPSWVDADHIAFQSTESGAFEIWVMRADGSGARQVTK